MIISILKEYGFKWIFNRTLYALKIKTLKIFPFSDVLFEKKVKIKNLDIYNINGLQIEGFLINLTKIEKQNIIDLADLALQGKIKAFSSTIIDYGLNVQWNYNPLTNKYFNKNLKWFKIPDFDKEKGDIKVIWELSRFTHFFYFLRAYIITKNIKYFNGFINQVKSWVYLNRYSYGPNYKCGQEASLRMMNLLLVFSGFKFYGLTTNELENNIKIIVEGSYRKILSNFFYSHKCIRNNHTFSEICGLILGSLLEKNTNRYNKALHLLNREIIYQFSCDGGYIQKSFNYQRFSLDIMCYIANITKGTSVFTDESISRIINSAKILYNVQNKDGYVPNYGANDGSNIFPLALTDFRDFRPIVDSIYSIFKKENIYPKGLFSEKKYWFTECKSLKKTKLEKSSFSFDDAGLYGIRNNENFIMISNNKFLTRPSHMDQNHIDVWVGKYNIFCDSGTYSYSSKIGVGLLKNNAHNTISVLNKPQMSFKEPFLIYDWTKKDIVIHSINSYDGAIISKNGYTHRRLINLKKNIILIEDIIAVDNDDNNVYSYFITCQDIEVNKINNTVLIKRKNGLIATLKSIDEFDVLDGFVSFYYLNKDKAKIIRFKAKRRINKNHILNYEIVINN
ncbi:heparinase II/III family protein [Candidatus Izemoplasma sp. B36]|uniref:heparinase II/III domain-containing protein n=1 Tax=Candidatus Izemoplasma sp. B36 TaxID=3242468 RepID=UPI0035568E0A